MKKNSCWFLTSFFNHSNSSVLNRHELHPLKEIQSPRSTTPSPPPPRPKIIYYYNPHHLSINQSTFSIPTNNINQNLILKSNRPKWSQNERRCTAWTQDEGQQQQQQQKRSICTYNNGYDFNCCTVQKLLPQGGVNIFDLDLNLNFDTKLLKTKRRSMSVYSPVGSPPTPYGSPTGVTSAEGPDDIVALSSGFDRRRRTLRRRLSTICDSPPPEQEKDKDGIPIEKMAGVVEQEEDEGSEITGLVGGILKEKKFENIIEQLEKVIQYRGRNISHIIVEKAVKDVCTDFDGLDESQKLNFFNLIAEKYSVDHQNITTIAMSLAECKDENTRLTIQDKLRASLVPQYQWLFSQIGRLEGGVKFLVDLRTDLLEIPLKFPEEGSFHLKSMNSSLKDLIAMWFAVGFLSLERVTWNSPCDMLQKISEYEAVHPMRNWTDLKRRVGAYRRCFVFTHGSMPLEPVVVLHTALTDHIPSSIATIVTNARQRMSLDGSADMGNGVAEDPDHITTAIFYSITSTQKGLAGIELGNYLIKQVVKELQKEFPKMSMFSSLSPIPGFRNWLLGELKHAIKGLHTDDTQFLFNPEELKTIAEILGCPSEINESVSESSGDKIGQSQGQVFKKLHQLISDGSWVENDKLFNELEDPMMRLCARYLVLTKRRGFALDSVANFHLKNGAVIWRLNWRGNLKAKGLKESCGIMVNYRYFLEECESNSQNYMESQDIKLSDQVRHLVKLAKNEGTSSPPIVISPSKI